MSALVDVSACGPVLETGKKKSAWSREARAYLSLHPESQRERSPPAFDRHVHWSACGELRRSAETGATGFLAQEEAHQMKALREKSCRLMVRILIVEGHASIREYLRSVLERLGHQVTEARDGAEGLELARLTPPAIVFIDILMPTMDGYEFVSALRSQPGQSTLPVIFWTAAYLKPEALGLAQECGVLHIASKSALPDEISWLVAQCLGEDSRSSAFAVDQQVIPGDLRVAQAADRRRTVDLHNANHRLSALTELGRSMANQSSVPLLLKELCEGARYLLGARVAFAFTIDSHSGRMNFSHLSGTSSTLQRDDIERVSILWLESLSPQNRTARVAAGNDVMVRAFQAALPRCTKPYLGAVMLNPIAGMGRSACLRNKDWGNRF